MQLTDFITGLVSKGTVSVTAEFTPFSPDDITQSIDLLRHFYDEDKINMPLAAPAFSERAAGWAAVTIFEIVKLAVMRDAGEEIILQRLKDFDEIMTPEVIYSADLTLRYLPDVFELAKGLAPADVLVKEIKRLGTLWPFSSIGIETAGILNEDVVLSHPSLKIEYIDRIIQAKDRNRLCNPAVHSLTLEVIGNYTDIFWPQLNLYETQHENDK